MVARTAAGAVPARARNDTLPCCPHPLLTLLDQVNPIHNRFDLWELTTLYQEVHGSAYWYLPVGTLGIPEEIWILPAQNVTPRREPGSPNVVDFYEYKVSGNTEL